MDPRFIKPLNRSLGRFALVSWFSRKFLQRICRDWQGYKTSEVIHANREKKKNTTRTQRCLSCQQEKRLCVHVVLSGMVCEPLCIEHSHFFFWKMDKLSERWGQKRLQISLEHAREKRAITSSLHYSVSRVMSPGWPICPLISSPILMLPRRSCPRFSQ